MLNPMYIVSKISKLQTNSNLLPLETVSGLFYAKLRSIAAGVFGPVSIGSDKNAPDLVRVYPGYLDNISVMICLPYNL